MELEIFAVKCEMRSFSCELLPLLELEVFAAKFEMMRFCYELWNEKFLLQIVV